MNQDLPIVAIVFGTTTAVLFPLVRAVARRIENRGQPPAQLPDDLTARIERIERAVDAVAVEVERISEGQRFVTKLLAERAETPKLPH
jgi:hypothetical protein